MQILAGVMPDAGVTASQFSPAAVETVAEKLAPEEAPLSVKQTCAGGGEFA